MYKNYKLTEKEFLYLKISNLLKFSAGAIAPPGPLPSVSETYS